MKTGDIVYCVGNTETAKIVRETQNYAITEHGNYISKRTGIVKGTYSHYGFNSIRWELVTPEIQKELNVKRGIKKVENYLWKLHRSAKITEENYIEFAQHLVPLYKKYILEKSE